VVAIASVSPVGNVSGSQMLTINGVNLPATANVNTVVFNQGGGDPHAARGRRDAGDHALPG
jgi:hypothetical protein